MKVGSNESTNIWNDLWISDTNNTWATTNMVPELQSAKVNSLLKFGLKEWDHDIVLDIFNETDVGKILQISLGMNDVQDAWIWIEDEKGNYTVKSGYRLLRNM